MKPNRASVGVAAISLLLLVTTGCRPAERWNGELIEPARPAPELAGVNWDGQPYRLSEHRGKVVLVFFGYTYCPDVCPFTLAKMKKLRAQLGERAEQLEVVFVSVDPKRDTVEKLASYVPSFDRGFYGLRLEPGEVEAIAKTFDVTVQYGQPEAGPGTKTYYYVDHTGTFFIVDREGRLRLKFPPDATPELMLPDVERLLGEPGGKVVQPVAGAVAAAPPPAQRLEIREPMATVVPGMAAVYFTVVNPGERADRLLRVETAAASTAEIHESLEQDGVVRMVAHPDGLEIPAGASLALVPGGKHVMLIEPRLPEGETAALRLTLHFENAGAIEVEAPVHALAGASDEAQEPHHHDHGAGMP